MADLLTTTRQEIEQRLQELRPLVAEAERLERALAALSAAGEPVRADEAAPRPAPRPAQSAPPRRARQPAPSDGTPRRRGAPPGRRGGATRANQFLEIIREGSGTSIGEAAARMGTSPNYLYRLAATLQEEGLIQKRGRSFVAVGAARDPGAQVEPDPTSAWESSSAVAIPGEVHREEVAQGAPPAGVAPAVSGTGPPPYESPGTAVAIDAASDAGPAGGAFEEAPVDVGDDPAMPIPEAGAAAERDFEPEAGSEAEPDAGSAFEPDFESEAGAESQPGPGLEPGAGADFEPDELAELPWPTTPTADPGGGEDTQPPASGPAGRPGFDF